MNPNCFWNMPNKIIAFMLSVWFVAFYILKINYKDVIELPNIRNQSRVSEAARPSIWLHEQMKQFPNSLTARALLITVGRRTGVMAHVTIGEGWWGTAVGSTPMPIPLYPYPYPYTYPYPYPYVYPYPYTYPYPYSHPHPNPHPDPFAGWPKLQPSCHTRLTSKETSLPPPSAVKKVTHKNCECHFGFEQLMRHTKSRVCEMIPKCFQKSPKLRLSLCLVCFVSHFWKFTNDDSYQ